MEGHGGKSDMRDKGGLTVQALWLALASLMSMSVGIVTSMVLSRLLDQTGPPGAERTPPAPAG